MADLPQLGVEFLAKNYDTYIAQLNSAVAESRAAQAALQNMTIGVKFQMTGANQGQIKAEFRKASETIQAEGRRLEQSMRTGTAASTRGTTADNAATNALNQRAAALGEVSRIEEEFERRRVAGMSTRQRAARDFENELQQAQRLRASLIASGQTEQQARQRESELFTEASRRYQSTISGLREAEAAQSDKATTTAQRKADALNNTISGYESRLTRMGVSAGRQFDIFASIEEERAQWNKKIDDLGTQYAGSMTAETRARMEGMRKGIDDIFNERTSQASAQLGERIRASSFSSSFLGRLAREETRTYGLRILSGEMQRFGATLFAGGSAMLFGAKQASEKYLTEYRQPISRVSRALGLTPDLREELDTLMLQRAGQESMFPATDQATAMRVWAEAMNVAVKSSEDLLSVSGETGLVIQTDLVSNLVKLNEGTATLDQTVTDTAAIMTQFGMTSSDAGVQVRNLTEVVALLDTAAASGLANVEDIGAALKFFAGRASDLGVSLPESVAAVETLAQVGIKGSQAGRGLDQLLRGIVAPSPKAIATYQELIGMDFSQSFFDAEGNFKGLANYLQVMAEATAGLTSEERQAKIATLGDANAMRVLNAMLGRTLEAYAIQVDYLGTLTKLRESGIVGIEQEVAALEQMTGLDFGNLSAVDSFNERMDDLRGQIEQQWTSALAELDAAWLRLGKSLSTEVVPAVQSVAHWMNVIAGIAEKNPWLLQGVLNVGKVAVGGGALLLVAGTVSRALVDIMTVTSALRGAGGLAGIRAPGGFAGYTETAVKNIVAGGRLAESGALLDSQMVAIAKVGSKAALSPDALAKILVGTGAVVSPAALEAAKAAAAKAAGSVAGAATATAEGLAAAEGGIAAGATAAATQSLKGKIGGAIGGIVGAVFRNFGLVFLWTQVADMIIKQQQRATVEDISTYTSPTAASLRALSDPTTLGRYPGPVGLLTALNRGTRDLANDLAMTDIGQDVNEWLEDTLSESAQQGIRAFGAALDPDNWFKSLGAGIERWVSDPTNLLAEPEQAMVARINTAIAQFVEDGVLGFLKGMLPGANQPQYEAEKERLDLGMSATDYARYRAQRALGEGDYSTRHPRMQDLMSTLPRGFRSATDASDYYADAMESIFTLEPDDERITKLMDDLLEKSSNFAAEMQAAGVPTEKIQDFLSLASDQMGELNVSAGTTITTIWELVAAATAVEEALNKAAQQALAISQLRAGEVGQEYKTPLTLDAVGVSSMVEDTGKQAKDIGEKLTEFGLDDTYVADLVNQAIDTANVVGLGLIASLADEQAKITAAYDAGEMDVTAFEALMAQYQEVKTAAVTDALGDVLNTLNALFAGETLKVSALTSDQKTVADLTRQKEVVLAGNLPTDQTTLYLNAFNKAMSNVGTSTKKATLTLEDMVRSLRSMISEKLSPDAGLTVTAEDMALTDLGKYTDGAWEPLRRLASAATDQNTDWKDMLPAGIGVNSDAARAYFEQVKAGVERFDPAFSAFFPDKQKIIGNVISDLEGQQRKEEFVTSVVKEMATMGYDEETLRKYFEGPEKELEASLDYLNSGVDGLETATSDNTTATRDLKDKNDTLITSTDAAVVAMNNLAAVVSGKTGGEEDDGTEEEVPPDETNPTKKKGGIQQFARGGLVTKPTFALIGEAGPELVLPLSKLAGGGRGFVLPSPQVNMRTMAPQIGQMNFNTQVSSPSPAFVAHAVNNMQRRSAVNLGREILRAATKEGY